MTIFDIETIAAADAAEFMEEPTAPANYKDPEKIAAYIAEAKVFQLGRCSLDPDLCEVAAIGLMWGAMSAPLTITRENFSEADMLREFWSSVKSGIEPVTPTITYNGFGFDWPVIIRRSQYLGIKHPAVSLDRYRSPHIDLMERLSFNGKLKYRSLDFYCRRFSIVTDDEVRGSEIGACVAAGEWDKVRGHVQADVEKTKQLAQRLGML